MRRIDGHLSTLAQSNVDARALVAVETRPDGSQTWQLEIPGAEPLGLGENFGAASKAIYAIVRATKARGEKS